MECSFCLAALCAQKAAKMLLSTEKEHCQGPACILLSWQSVFSDGHKSNRQNSVFSDLTLKHWASGIPLLVPLLVILLKICLLLSTKRPERSGPLPDQSYKEDQSLSKQTHGGFVVPWCEV